MYYIIQKINNDWENIIIKSATKDEVIYLYFSTISKNYKRVLRLNNLIEEVFGLFFTTHHFTDIDFTHKNDSVKYLILNTANETASNDIRKVYKKYIEQKLKTYQRKKKYEKIIKNE